MNKSARKVVTIDLSVAQTLGPRIVAELKAGKVVDVAGFLLRLVTAQIERPALELTP